MDLKEQSLYEMENYKVTIIHNDDLVDQNKLVKIANQMIRTQQDLNLNQMRIIYIIISQIKMSEDANTVKNNIYRFQAKDFFMRLKPHKLGPKKLGGSDYAKLADDINELRKKDFVIRDGINLISAGWVSAARYTEGIIEIEIANMILPYLTMLGGNFTSIGINYLMLLKSTYTMKMYELLKSWETKGRIYYKVKELKYLLNAENYTTGHFNKKILIPSIEEIKKKCDLDITYRTDREGNLITAYAFTITNKNTIKQTQNVAKMKNYSEQQKLLNSQNTKEKTENQNLFEF